MLASLFTNYLYIPIYNLLILLASLVPGGDIGIAVILVTLAVKFVVAPLSIRALVTQRRMRQIEPELKALKAKYKNDRETQAREMMSLYKNNGIRPFASILALFLQIPVVIALYLVFAREQLLSVNAALIYPFIAFPTDLSPLFLGFFQTTSHSLTLAALAALAQFLQALITIPVPPPVKGGTGLTSEEFARIIALQARFGLPVIIGVVAYTSGAIALYFITSSLFGIAQEYYVRWRHPILFIEPAAA